MAKKKAVPTTRPFERILQEYIRRISHDIRSLGFDPDTPVTAKGKATAKQAGSALSFQRILVETTALLASYRNASKVAQPLIEAAYRVGGGHNWFEFEANILEGLSSEGRRPRGGASTKMKYKDIDKDIERKLRNRVHNHNDDEFAAIAHVERAHKGQRGYGHNKIVKVYHAAEPPIAKLSSES